MWSICRKDAVVEGARRADRSTSGSRRRLWSPSGQVQRPHLVSEQTPWAERARLIIIIISSSNSNISTCRNRDSSSCGRLHRRRSSLSSVHYPMRSVASWDHQRRRRTGRRDQTVQILQRADRRHQHAVRLLASCARRPLAAHRYSSSSGEIHGEHKSAFVSATTPTFMYSPC